MTDLNDFANFHAVVTCGSLTAAARHLGVPKATVSKRLARLESDLDVRLLERTTRRLRLTEVGQAVFEQSEAIVSGLEFAQAVAQNARAEPNGIVRVSCPQGLMPHLVEEMLRRFLHTYPRVQLEVVEVNRPVDLITEGVDLALRVRTNITDDMSLIMRRLGTSRRLLVASPAMLKNCPPDMTIDDLVAQPVLALNEEGQHWDLVDATGKLHSVSIRPRLRCGDFFVLSQAALDGLGIAMLPEHLCRHKLETGTLVRVLPGWQSGEGVIHAVYASRRGQRSAVRALIDFLAEEFSRRKE
ncbi:LysR family transcriptional regulator [Paraburkholderia sp. LEh10]|uniref:LysR family transcriptional regulator n=1 Tax=Paraburkholderia sp. LEh10 TaxID=2821353 RepID=UPI001AE5E082|nr:LysR family transcriptional regulator [Paraburkholderia sp. LEh10]MBP0590419.1 LysR family transcriptional regulator [Paraburkholderia sp. LEh10]